MVMVHTFDTGVVIHAPPIQPNMSTRLALVQTAACDGSALCAHGRRGPLRYRCGTLSTGRGSGTAQARLSRLRTR